MNDLSDLVCPQLFVQFKFCLKQAHTRNEVNYLFAKNADLDDVIRYLNTHQYQFKMHQNTLTVTCVREEQS